MALVRPSFSFESLVFDAQKDNEITFNVFGGDQYTGYEVEIFNNETNELFFSASKTTYSKKFLLEANTLSNGIEYRIRVRTCIITETSEEYSGYSDQVIIKCYSTPTCSIDNLTNEAGNRVITNQNYSFEGSFFQSEGIALSSYQFILYGADKEPIQEFNKVFTSASKFTQAVEGFSPQADYFIELICVDENNFEVSTGLISFRVDYVAPRIKQIVELVNEKETASVKITSNMIQIIFKVDNAPPVYINEQEIDLRNNRAYLDEMINLVGNFTLKIYCRNIPRKAIGEEDYFLTLTSIDKTTKIRMKESEGRIHVYKIVTPKPSGADLVSHYVSPIIEGYIPNKSYVVIQINHVNRRIDVYARVTEMVA